MNPIKELPTTKGREGFPVKLSCNFKMAGRRPAIFAAFLEANYLDEYFHNRESESLKISILALRLVYRARFKKSKICTIEQFNTIQYLYSLK